MANMDGGQIIASVLEQVEGAGLDKLVSHLGRRKQKLGDAAIYFIASQLASALAHAHGSVDEFFF